MAIRHIYMDIRYLLIFLPIMIIWASHGVVLLSGWAGATFRLSASQEPIARKASIAVGLTTAMAFLLIALVGGGRVVDLTLYDYHNRPVKQAGEWLANFRPGPKTVMDSSQILAFHAGASLLWFPYSNSQSALKYINKKKADFVVLRPGGDFIGLEGYPYLKDWYENGIPDRRAQLIFNETTSHLGRIRIYKWNSD